MELGSSEALGNMRADGGSDDGTQIGSQAVKMFEVSCAARI